MTMQEKADSLRRAVQYGLMNNKKNIIVDLDVLQDLFLGKIAVGGNELPPEELTERFYEVRSQRDRLLHVVRCVGSSLAQTSEQIPPIVTRDLAEQCNEINQELNLP